MRAGTTGASGAAGGRSAGRERGQAATEFAIVMTVLLFICLGVFQMSHLVAAKFLNNFAAWAACRAGIVNRGNGNDEMTIAAANALSPLFGDTSDFPFGGYIGAMLDSRGRMVNDINGNLDGSNRTRVVVERPTAGTFGGSRYRFDDRGRPMDNLLTVRVEHDYELFVPLVGPILGRTFQFAADVGGYFLPGTPGGDVSPVTALIRTDGGRYLLRLQSKHTMRMQTDPTRSDFGY
jgi:hypothetical protein